MFNTARWLPSRPTTSRVQLNDSLAAITPPTSHVQPSHRDETGTCHHPICSYMTPCIVKNLHAKQNWGVTPKYDAMLKWFPEIKWKDKCKLRLCVCVCLTRLIDWLFNSTSTQKASTQTGQFVPTAGKETGSGS